MKSKHPIKILAILLALLVFSFYNFEIVVIRGQSMEPSLLAGEKVLASRFLLWFGNIDKGDIIIFPQPGTQDQLIKRVVKIEGSKIWVEGDNTTNSIDSRDFGPIEFGSIRAKVW